MIRVGVIGLGYGGRVLVPAFRAASCRVEAVCGTSLRRSRAAARKLRIPKAYGDWRRLVADPAIDAVAVAVPARRQLSIVLAALKNRKHVFCEKPIALSHRGALSMFRAAKRAGVATAVDFEFLEIPEWRRVAAMLRRKSVGRLRHISVSWQAGTRAQRTGRRSWKACRREGGGTLNLFGAHTLYYVERLFGRVRRLSAHLFQGRKAFSRAGDVCDVLVLELESGVPVSVVLSNEATGESHHRIEIYGDRGRILLENPTPDYASGFRIIRAGPGGGIQKISVRKPRIRGDGRIAATAAVARGFARRVRGGRAPGPTLADGLRVQRLIDAARRSNGVWVSVS